MRRGGGSETSAIFALPVFQGDDDDEDESKGVNLRTRMGVQNISGYPTHINIVRTNRTTFEPPVKTVTLTSIYQSQH